MLDVSASPDVQQFKPHEGEYMVSAKLVEVDAASGELIVEQIINEPNEKIIDPEVKLANDYRVYKSILIRSNESEREYTAEISINEIPFNTEIGIGFTRDNLARIIIAQEWFEE